MPSGHEKPNPSRILKLSVDIINSIEMLKYKEVLFRLVKMEGKSVSDIVIYLEKNVAKGYDIGGLKLALEHQGYPKTLIERALTIIDAKRPKDKGINEKKTTEAKPTQPIENNKVIGNIEIIEEDEEKRSGIITSLLKKLRILK